MARLNPVTRSILAVLDGFLLFIALQGAFYAVAYLGLHMSFDTPTPAYLGCNLLWTTLSALAAGFTTGRIARRKPVEHGIALAIPFLLLSLFNLNKGVGGRHTPFVVATNTLVPLAFIWGSYLAEQRRLRKAVR